MSIYGRTLTRVLRHPAITLAVLFGTIGLNVYLFIRVPKGFFPQQDNGRMMGAMQADQDTSFQAMQERLHDMMTICRNDPAVADDQRFTGGNFERDQHRAHVHELEAARGAQGLGRLVMARLRQKLASVPGAHFICKPRRISASARRGSFSLYQFTLRSDNLKDLGRLWSDDAEAVARDPADHRCQHRSAEQRPAIGCAL